MPGVMKESEENPNVSTGISIVRVHLFQVKLSDSLQCKNMMKIRARRETEEQRRKGRKRENEHIDTKLQTLKYKRKLTHHNFTYTIYITYDHHNFIHIS